MKRFSKAISLALLVFTMIFALAGCSTAPKQDLGDIVVAEVPAAEPVKEEAPVAEPAKEEAPAVEPAEETAEVAEAPVVEEAEEELKSEITVNVFGYDATFKIYENVIEITYPNFVTFDEVKAAAEVAYQTYPEYFKDSTLYVDSAAGTAVLTLASAPSLEDFNYAMKIVDSVLPSYVASVLGLEVENVVESIEEEGLSASISLFGYEASITMKDDIITIDYPDFISVDEVKAAAAAAYAAYKDYLEGAELVIDDGYATLKLAFKLGKEDFYYAVNLLESELSYYIAEVLGVADTATEAATEVVEAAPAVFESIFSFFNQEVEIVAEGNTVTFTYPATITNAEVATAAKAAYEAYSQYLDGSELTIDNGKAVLTLGYDLTEADFDYAVALLKSELTAYVASLIEDKVSEEAVDAITDAAKAISDALTSKEETTEEAPATEPAKEETKEEAPAEEPAKEETKEEAPATEPAKEETKEEAPATEPAKEETKTETKTETTTQPAATTTTATAEPAKKSNAGVIVLIVVLVAVAAAAVVLFLKKKKN